MGQREALGSVDGGIGRSKSLRVGSRATDIGLVRRVAADGPRQRAVRPRDIPRNPELQIPKAHLLMRAVETADAEVHDAGGEISAVARDRLGAGDGARHVLRAEVRAGGELGRVRQCRLAQPHPRFLFARCEFHAFCSGSQKGCAPSALKLSRVLIGWRRESVRVKRRKSLNGGLRTVTHTPFRDPTAGFFTKIDPPPYAVTSDSLLRRISAEGWKTRSQTQNDGLFQNKMKISRVFRGSSATRFGDISSAGGGNGEFRREIRLTRHTERTRHRSRHASESAVESDSHRECVTAARCASGPSRKRIASSVLGLRTVKSESV